MIKLSAIKKNENNPRFIKDEKFNKLKANISKYPKFLELRPIVIHSFEDPVILGGNMRYEALKALGYKEIPEAWVKTASEFTEDELKAFVILDNVGFGDWDHDILANDWDIEELSNWGVDLPNFDINAPNSLDDLEDEIPDANGSSKTNECKCPKCGFTWLTR